jgi:hypothetical protein
MKTTQMFSRRIAFVLAAAAVLSFVPELNAQNNAAGPDPSSVISTINMDNVQLTDAIELLARQASFNYIVDQRVPSPAVNLHVENSTAKDALVKLLKDHDLVLVENPATSVARIAPKDLGIKPVSSEQVGGNTNMNVSPVISMTGASLDTAIELIADAGHIKVVLDKSVSQERAASPSTGLPSFRWQNLTPKQALVALLDNYDLVMTEDPATSSTRITAKEKTDAKPASSDKPELKKTN